MYEGIKFDSILNSLSHYVCEPGMPPCIGHDLFEGIIPYDLCLMMKYFVKVKKYFTYKLVTQKFLLKMRMQQTSQDIFHSKIKLSVMLFKTGA